jgi:hypothetical protein
MLPYGLRGTWAIGRLSLNPIRAVYRPGHDSPGRFGLEEWLRWLAMKGKGRFAVWAKVIRLIILR